MSNLEIDSLINEISKLPGFGRKSAQRITLFLLKNKSKALVPLIEKLKTANDKIINCEICFNIDTVTPCSLCESNKRDHLTICVVEDISDLWTLERIGFYKGLYHILGGNLSAVNGIGIDDLSINKLINRVKDNNIKEVILALSTNMEGQTTSHVIADKLKSLDVEVSKLAQGVPIGGEFQYLDENTISTAFQSRKSIL
ncbi:MAG: Recombination protein RecR [Alphaproteobacteria bacterium MarineAlpha5_Bin9]|nr:MAG: Recombination protein RecR [Alphaproteobacteria bacterium MarineAlpha5_Bin9]|tara:strand:+ start:12443 stop:13039 length:597 start_codon:yes stop_codon:yes gene_type:complete